MENIADRILSFFGVKQKGIEEKIEFPIPGDTFLFCNFLGQEAQLYLSDIISGASGLRGYKGLVISKERKLDEDLQLYSKKIDFYPISNDNYRELNTVPPKTENIKVIINQRIDRETGYPKTVILLDDLAYLSEICGLEDPKYNGASTQYRNRRRGFSPSVLRFTRKLADEITANKKAILLLPYKKGELTQKELALLIRSNIIELPNEYYPGVHNKYKRFIALNRK